MRSSLRPPVTFAPALPRNCTNVGFDPSVALVTPLGARLNVSPLTVPGPLTGVAVLPAVTTTVSGGVAGGAAGSGLVVVPLPVFQLLLDQPHHPPAWFCCQT